VKGGGALKKDEVGQGGRGSPKSQFLVGRL